MENPTTPCVCKKGYIGIHCEGVTYINMKKLFVDCFKYQIMKLEIFHCTTLPINYVSSHTPNCNNVVIE